MIKYQRFCDQCSKDITDNNYDATINDNSINQHLHFCDMKCLGDYVLARYVSEDTPEFVK